MKPEVDRELSDGWSFDLLKLTRDLIARIPNPASVAVLADGSGFHGPIPRTLIDQATA